MYVVVLFLPGDPKGLTCITAFFGMRNLKLLKSLRSCELQCLGSPQCFSVRGDTGSLLLASQYSITEYDPRTGQVVSEASLTADSFLPEDGSGVVVGLQDLAEVESACLATAGGDVILFNLNTCQLECVGSVDSGLTSMSWSPDEELVILTTGQETVIMMTKDFEPITEMGIHQDDFGEARKVRVWNREGVLQATSEPINGLEQALCWKPSGSLIASTQRHPNKHSVVFMEKNGLLHGDFTLPFSKDQVKVKKLLWNSDSSVLAVWLQDMTAGEDGNVSSYIQLWTVGNYHWYLKQSLDFGRDPQKAPACVCWDPERPLQLHVVTCDWTTIAYDWGWTTERSPGLDATDNANVAVIDGDKILVTTFRQCVVPPPMCSFELQLKSPVNQVTFLCQPQRTNQLAAFTADGLISIFSQVSWKDPYVDYCVMHIKCVFFFFFFFFFFFLNENLSPSLFPVLWNVLVLTVFSPVDCAEPSVVEWRDSNGCSISFPVPCVQTVLCNIGQEEYLLGLTDRSHLYAGDTELASNISSFSVCNDFLVITTHSHTCMFWASLQIMSMLVQFSLASDGGQNDETLRRVERGSRIVTVVPQDTRVILQMPRGNLETVHHRALVLAQLRRWLDSLKFRESFECMRKLRINLNLIYDHSPKVFLENIETFITQLDSINHINLFLTELKEEDTTSTMYPRPENSPVRPQTASGKKKVDVVCDALKSTMESMDPNKFCLSILTAHVKKTVPELEIALQKVHELRANPPKSPGAVSAEEALKYLLFLVNVNDLYEHSLGTYDFDLVLMVAEKSQKDPKEYLPFLNMLKSLEPNYQRFTIDKHLKRYRKALFHLSKCGQEHFPEALQLVKQQKLYNEALRLFTADSAQYKALSCAYAEHLVEQQQAEQAGLLLWRCGEITSALQAFATSNSWRNAICVAQQIPLPPDQLALLARDLAGNQKLTEQRRYSEAALLLDQYAKDCEEAILALITGAVWEEALRLIYMHNRQDITETNLKPALLEGNNCSALYVQLLVTATMKCIDSSSDEDGPDCADAELYSEASSVMTGSKYSHSNSRISSRSSKNRRKAERKKLSLKEGSPLEDKALMYALGEIITTEVHSLLKTLVLFQFDKHAEKLQQAYDEALHKMEAAIPEVWPDGLQNNQAPVNKYSHFNPCLKLNKTKQSKIR
uniref:Elongator complex protein 1 n=1 Tax=Sphaeramia orbicularis TaxID=375764 RepID=A0A672ZM53_9TELE